MFFAAGSEDGTIQGPCGELRGSARARGSLRGAKSPIAPGRRANSRRAAQFGREQRKQIEIVDVLLAVGERGEAMVGGVELFAGQRAAELRVAPAQGVPPGMF